MRPNPSGISRITLADVAREAGVSVQTASHVLADNQTVRLSAATRERVKEAARKVGYRPNRLAQAMKRGRTDMVAIWIPLERPSMVYLEFIQLIGKRARQDGYDLMIIDIDPHLAYGANGRQPAIWPVDGILAVDAGKAVSFFREDPQNANVPVLVFGLEQYANSDSVSWDVRTAAYEATRDLIRKGRKEIVHITLDWVIEKYPREQRRRGYTEAMTEAGLQPKYAVSNGESSSAAERGMAEYLSGDNPRPDGLIGFTDPITIGACRALLGEGMTIPGDCEVVGYGDFPEAAEFRVPISTLKVPIAGLVERAWTWLKERMDAGDVGESRLDVLPMKFIQRESTQSI